MGWAMGMGDGHLRPLDMSRGEGPGFATQNGHGLWRLDLRCRTGPPTDIVWLGHGLVPAEAIPELGRWGVRHLEWRYLVRRNFGPIRKYHYKFWYKSPRLWHKSMNRVCWFLDAC